MNCRKVSHLLSAYMDAELPGFEHRQVHEHIGRCEDCAHEYQSLLQMKRLLAGMRMREPQADLPGRILNHIHTQHANSRSDWLSNWWSMLNGWMEIQIPRRASLPIAASIAFAGVVYASCIIDRSEEIAFRRDTADAGFHTMPSAMVAELQPAQASAPDNLYPTQDYHFQPPISYAGAQTVGNRFINPPVFESTQSPLRRYPNQRQRQLAPSLNLLGQQGQR